MTLNCSTKPTVNFRQIMHSNEFENDIPSDALDAMADQVYEQEQAMRESAPEEWLGLDKSIHTLSNVHF